MGLVSFPAGGVAVVVGSGGGIGGALVGRLRVDGRFARVYALGRRTDPPVDLLDETSIAEATETVCSAGDLRLVLDATGVLHGDALRPEKSWAEVDPAALSKAFAVNATGPMLLMKHLLPRLPRQGKAMFATLSARVGSIGDNRLGGWYAYRASKAALNQFVRTAAVELRRRRPEALCVALHPGTVATPLSAPFAKTGLEVQVPLMAAERLLAVADALQPGQSGGFFDQHGRPVPW